MKLQKDKWYAVDYNGEGHIYRKAYNTRFEAELAANRIEKKTGKTILFDTGEIIMNDFNMGVSNGI